MEYLPVPTEMIVVMVTISVTIIVVMVSLLNALGLSSCYKWIFSRRWLSKSKDTVKGKFHDAHDHQRKEISATKRHLSVLTNAVQNNRDGHDQQNRSRHCRCCSCRSGHQPYPIKMEEECGKGDFPPHHTKIIQTSAMDELSGHSRKNTEKVVQECIEYSCPCHNTTKVVAGMSNMFVDKNVEYFDRRTFRSGFDSCSQNLVIRCPHCLTWVSVASDQQVSKCKLNYDKFDGQHCGFTSLPADYNVSSTSKVEQSDRKSALFNGSIKSSVAGTITAAAAATTPTTIDSNTRTIDSNTRTILSNTRTILSTAKTAKEVVRLESLCEARTKELTQTKIQLKASGTAFDAMAALLNYCCFELKAFECPQLAQKLETVQKQLSGCLAEIDELTSQKETLTQNLSQATKDKEEETKRTEEAITSALLEKEEHERLQNEMDSTHNAALTTQRDELTNKHEDISSKLKQQQEQQLQLLKQSLERRMSDMKNEGRLELSSLRIRHLEEIQALRNKHDSQMEELHKQHRNKLEDITHRFESIKVILSEKVESLRGECDDLRHRARSSEEALQKDADVKVQMALTPFLSLPKEIDSLKAVVEMRNEEVQRLRSRNVDLEKQLEEIPIAREKIISLQQKVENLEAIINIKTDHEKQLHEKCQVLMRKYDRETRANKRLSMDYEQVMWRMSQSEYGSSESLSKRQLSRSPTRSEMTSPDSHRRRASPSLSEVTLRVKKRSSNSESEGDRKLRSRSATFVLEKNEDKEGHGSAGQGHYPSGSPQSTPRRWKKKMEVGGGGGVDHRQEVENGENGGLSIDRMCHSAGAEMISASLDESKCVWNVNINASQSSGMMDEGMDSLPFDTTGEMNHSYARSLSGISDSGVYDSMTRSDMLNSSILSTDSEWMASANVSMNLDTTTDGVESSFVSHHGKGVTNSDTVLDMTTVQMDKEQDSSSNMADASSCSSSVTSGDATFFEKERPSSSSNNNVHHSNDLQLSFSNGNEDDVFVNKDVHRGVDIEGDGVVSSRTLDSLPNSQSADNSSNANCDVQVSFSHNMTANSSSPSSEPL